MQKNEIIFCSYWQQVVISYHLLQYRIMCYKLQLRYDSCVDGFIMSRVER
jgi:hypothetical protein